MHAILNNVFMNNTNISIEQIIKPFQYEEETPENIGYMRAALTDSDFILGDAGPNSYVKYVIRPTQEYVKKQEISRRRNWCASRQIQCSTLELTEITDSESLEFICPITFEPQKVGDWVIKLTECGHKFSSGGIMEWCRENTTCPVCRADLANGKLSGANCEMLELV
jgi:hypothetical protein